MSNKFIGKYEVSMDSKNRIVIPSRWKERLGMEIVISESFEDSLAIRTEAGFEDYCNEILGNDDNDRKSRVLRRKILGGSSNIVLDKWHRFVVPSNLLNKLGKGPLVMIGVGNLIELWNQSKYEEWERMEENKLDSVAQELSEQKK
nr:cell division protein MraZ [Mycoplasma haemofelis]